MDKRRKDQAQQKSQRAKIGKKTMKNSAAKERDNPSRTRIKRGIAKLEQLLEDHGYAKGIVTTIVKQVRKCAKPKSTDVVGDYYWRHLKMQAKRKGEVSYEAEIVVEIEPKSDHASIFSWSDWTGRVSIHRLVLDGESHQVDADVCQLNFSRNKKQK